MANPMAQEIAEGEHTFEPGTLPPRWTSETHGGAQAPPFTVHEYNPGFFIIRQSGSTNFEKPFLYLLFGSREALLIDTGAPGADVSIVILAALRRDAERRRQPALPLLVVHSHGHSDHVAGDEALRRQPAVRVVDATEEAVGALFGIRHWPHGLGMYDLGGRIIDVIPVPGHGPASIAIYDRRTGILLAADVLYPGRLYVRDAQAFAESIDRLVEFTATRAVTHVLGAHIENTRTPYVDYPEGTTFQPDEHALELGRAHLLELQDGLRRMGSQLQRRAFRDFTIWPVVP
jgi:hydroxyacylglutathione hydrolase